MSTYVGIVCWDCQVGIGPNRNHGWELMRLLVEHREAVAALAPLDGEIEIVAFVAEGSVRPSEFATHLAHRLRVVDEYGHLDDECNEWERSGPHTVTGRICRLAKGHDGQHEPQDPQRLTFRSRGGE